MAHPLARITRVNIFPYCIYPPELVNGTGSVKRLTIAHFAPADTRRVVQRERWCLEGHTRGAWLWSSAREQLSVGLKIFSMNCIKKRLTRSCQHVRLQPLFLR